MYSIASTILISCIKMPEFRENLDAGESDSGSLEQDLAFQEEDTAVSDVDFSESISDTFVSCDSREIADDGTCLDQSLLTDLDGVCDSDNMLCQDEDYNVVDMQIPEHSQFSNNKCINMKRNSFLEADGALFSDSLGRLSNGAGAEDSWTISVFIETGETANSQQTLLYYGSNQPGQSQIGIYWGRRNSESGRNLLFIYGTDANYLEFQTPVRSIQRSTSYHLMIIYDGGTTGSQNSQLEDSLSRFKIFIDGIQQELTTSHSNYGVDTPFQGEYLWIGKHPTEDYHLQNCKVDELAIWDSNQYVNILDIYNNGIPRDLNQLDSTPSHWWRLGDGDMDNYPILWDQVGEAHFTMYNMSIDDIVDF